MRINNGVKDAVRSISSKNKKQEAFYITKTKDKNFILRSPENIFKP